MNNVLVLKNTEWFTKHLLWLNTTVRATEQFSWIVNTAKYGPATPNKDSDKVPEVVKTAKDWYVMDVFNFLTSYSTWRILALAAEAMTLRTQPLRLLTQYTFTLSQVTLAAYVIGELFAFGFETAGQMRTNELNAKYKLLEMIDKNTEIAKTDKALVVEKGTLLSNVLTYKTTVTPPSGSVSAPKEIYKKESYWDTTKNILKTYGLSTVIGFSSLSLVSATNNYISSGAGFANAMFKGAAFTTTHELVKNGLLNTSAMLNTLFSLSPVLMRLFSSFTFLLSQDHNHRADEMNKLSAKLAFEKDHTEAELVKLAFDSEVAKNIVQGKEANDKLTDKKLTEADIVKNAKDAAIAKFSTSEFKVNSKVIEAMKHVFWDNFGVESWKVNYKPSKAGEEQHDKDRVRVSFTDLIENERKNPSKTIGIAPAA